MASTPYIPPRDGDFDPWFLNFQALISATPTAYGLVAGDATAITAQYTAWHSAWLLLANPATNTAPNVAAKDVARANAEGTIRPYAMRIRASQAVSDALKVGLGLNVPPATNTPIPPPTTFPNLSLRSGTVLRHTIVYQDSDATSGKAKAAGTVGVEVVATVAVAPATDPDAATPLSIATKSPFAQNWNPSQQGKIATIWGRYLTRSGPGGIVQRGPWGPPLTITIM